jgi:type VI secretion system protein ImpI
MYLTLEIVSAAVLPSGNARRKVFSVDGGRIGRAGECDMVLDGAGVHRHHATIRFINGVFFVEGVGTNGIAVNVAERVLPRNEPYPLKSGDKLFIDEFELAVSVSAAAPAEPISAGSHAGMRPMTEVTGPGPGARATAPSLIDAPLALAPDDLDPLRQLSGRAPPRPQASPVAPAWNHSSALADHFTPPPPPGAAGGAGSAIPEDWDKTSFNRSKLPPAQPLHSAPPPPAPANIRAPAPAQRTTPTPGAQPVGGGGAAFEWEAFLRAAGVDPAAAPADTAAVLGHIMRSVVQGLIEILRARSEIKSQFRLPLTQVKVSENNPLKFAANAEDALNTLFGRQSTAYLKPKDAFDDAFDDVRFHQLAMLAGVRAGFDSIMSRFDPVQLQESFAKRGGRGLFGGGSKTKYWELYEERFRELTADSDDTFRRLFGEEFAREYERQLGVLKRGRSGS